jgi:predicted small lipoprotein YifL
MLKFKPIVGACIAAVLLAVVACGQKGALVLPSDPAAQNRATLPQILSPAQPASAPSSAASAPKR